MGDRALHRFDVELLVHLLRAELDDVDFARRIADNEEFLGLGSVIDRDQVQMHFATVAIVLEQSVQRLALVEVRQDKLVEALVDLTVDHLFQFSRRAHPLLIRGQGLSRVELLDLSERASVKRAGQVRQHDREVGGNVVLECNAVFLVLDREWRRIDLALGNPVRRQAGRLLVQDGRHLLSIEVDLLAELRRLVLQHRVLILRLRANTLSVEAGDR